VGWRSSQVVMDSRNSSSLILMMSNTHNVRNPASPLLMRALSPTDIEMFAVGSDVNAIYCHSNATAN
jgi:hypothetical protein